MTPETQQAVRELAAAMDLPEDEVIARAVKALAMVRAMLWTGPVWKDAPRVVVPPEYLE